MRQAAKIKQAKNAVLLMYNVNNSDFASASFSLSLLSSVLRGNDRGHWVKLRSVVWPNGYGVGFRRRRLQVRVLSRSRFVFWSDSNGLLLSLCCAAHTTRSPSARHSRAGGTRVLSRSWVGQLPHFARPAFQRQSSEEQDQHRLPSPNCDNGWQTIPRHQDS